MWVVVLTGGLLVAGAPAQGSAAGSGGIESGVQVMDALAFGFWVGLLVAVVVVMSRKRRR